MIYYVNQAMLHDGDGSLGTPFRRISEAAKIAKPGDEVLVFPGVYREYVNPERGGTEGCTPFSIVPSSRWAR